MISLSSNTFTQGFSLNKGGENPPFLKGDAGRFFEKNNLLCNEWNTPGKSKHRMQRELHPMTTQAHLVIRTNGIPALFNFK